MYITASTPCLVSLPDGTVVDIATKEGANSFLNGVSSFDYFSSSLKEIRKLRKKKRLNAHDEKKLEELHSFMELIAKADEEIFRSKIPESEIQHWLNYVIEMIKSFTTMPLWLNRGLLEWNYLTVLVSCIGMFGSGGGHALPVRLAFHSDFFQVLANFIRVGKEGALSAPDISICCLVGEIAGCALETANFSLSLSMEEIFKKFEASGLLEQMLRCSTAHQRQVCALSEMFSLEHTRVYTDFLRYLERTAGFMARKFKTGKPCGNTLKAILDGRDGNRNVRPEILNHLKGIARLVEAMDPTEMKRFAFGTFFNFHCLRADSVATLECCSRCKIVHYCSKECQTANWKYHKKACHEHTTAERDRWMSLRAASTYFMFKNSKTVLGAIKKKRDSTGLMANALAVEIDITPNENGIIPAFDDPPTFKIAIIEDYKSGQEIPEWWKHKDNMTNLQRKEASKHLANRLENEGTNGPTAKLVLLYGGMVHIDDEFSHRFYRALFTRDPSQIFD